MRYLGTRDPTSLVCNLYVTGVLISSLFIIVYLSWLSNLYNVKFFLRNCVIIPYTVLYFVAATQLKMQLNIKILKSRIKDIDINVTW